VEKFKKRLEKKQIKKEIKNNKKKPR